MKIVINLFLVSLSAAVFSAAFAHDEENARYLFQKTSRVAEECFHNIVDHSEIYDEDNPLLPWTPDDLVDCAKKQSEARFNSYHHFCHEAHRVLWFLYDLGERGLFDFKFWNEDYCSSHNQYTE